MELVRPESEEEDEDDVLTIGDNSLSMSRLAEEAAGSLGLRQQVSTNSGPTVGGTSTTSKDLSQRSATTRKRGGGTQESSPPAAKRVATSELVGIM